MRFIYEIQDKEAAVASDVTFSPINLLTKDIEEPLAPNPKGLLFRYNVDMKDLSVAAPSFQLSCGHSNIRFVLQLLDHETEIRRVKGRGSATMYCCRLTAKSSEVFSYQKLMRRTTNMCYKVQWIPLTCRNYSQSYSITVNCHVLHPKNRFDRLGWNEKVLIPPSLRPKRRKSEVLLKTISQSLPMLIGKFE
jgi:hypothetical protein